jgi:V/A-type H+-transporting ATPase subunit I
MAVESMKMMNIVGQLDDFHQIMRAFILANDMQFIDVFRQIDESKFTLEMATENIDEIMEMSNLQTYQGERDLKELEEKLMLLSQHMNVSLTFEKKYCQEDYDFKPIEKRINKVYSVFEEDRSRIEKLEERLKRLKEMLCVEALDDIGVDLNALYSMTYFDIMFGRLSQENRKRLSMNYENVTAAVMHIDVPKYKNYYLVVSPRSLKKETERILRSVYFEKITFNEQYLDEPKVMLNKIKKDILKTENQLSELKEKVKNLEHNYIDDIKECYSKLVMEKKVESLGEKIAVTDHFFYCSAWIPESKVADSQKLLEKIERNIIVDLKASEESGLKAPTKLKNNWISKPFENLVYMYGVPNYTEVDPTVFFSITYMILFGAMFGDLGQGLVFFLAGFFIKRKKRMFGELLSRVGISSMFFGFFYDSLFGYEHLISEVIPLNIFIRPIENINTMLTVAVFLGVVLLYVSFAYSIFNKFKDSDIEEGIFGRNGVVGLILYTALLLIVANQFLEGFSFNQQFLTIIIFITIILMLLKEPIANKLKKEDYLYNESPGEYYVESGFELIETFLSMLSNTLSFIRIGAFALNHVGLFIAFQTMAELIGTTFGNVSMFILGNLLIIFLEGLVVFIQGLRLMYYEIFSKYYIGDGYKFEPSGLE